MEVHVVSPLSQVYLAMCVWVRVIKEQHKDIHGGASRNKIEKKNCIHPDWRSRKFWAVSENETIRNFSSVLLSSFWCCSFESVNRDHLISFLVFVFDFFFYCIHHEIESLISKPKFGWYSQIKKSRLLSIWIGWLVFVLFLVKQ